MNDGTIPRRAPADSPPLPGWLGGLGVAAAATLPVATGVPLSFLAKRPLHVTLFDPAIWLAAAATVAWCLRAGILRQRLRLWAAAVWPAGLLILAGLVSLFGMESFDAKAGKIAAKTLLQHLEYLLAGPFVWLPLLEDAAWRRRTMTALSIACAAAALAMAWWTPMGKVLSGAIHPYGAGGLLDNRNTYGLFVAMAACLLADWGRVEQIRAAERGDRPSPWWLGPVFILPLLLLYPVLAGGVLLAGLAGMTVVYCARHRAGAVLAMLLLLGWIYAGGSLDQTARRRILTRSIQVFRPVRDEASGMLESRHTMRYYRWAANLNMFLAHPVLGVGWGQYQRELDRYYGDIPHPEGRTDEVAAYDLRTAEPFTFGWFFLTAGEQGAVGLLALLVFLGELTARALGSRGGGRILLAGGVAGAVAALWLGGWWTQPLVRGAGPLLGFLLALSAVGVASEAETHIGHEGREDDADTT